MFTVTFWNFIEIVDTGLREVRTELTAQNKHYQQSGKYRIGDKIFVKILGGNLEQKKFAMVMIESTHII